VGMGAALSSMPNRLAILAGATALGCLFALGALPAFAQASATPTPRPAADAAQPATPEDIDVSGFGVPDGAEMLLESDTLIYDNDANTITAAGGVQIDYGGNRLAADRVTYDRASGRLIAAGGVELLDRQGNRIFAEQVDITDDFADGFVRSLRIETAERTFFTATSAQRERGEVTTFNEGTYTACEPCREQPEKPPSWRIRAQKVIWNARSQTIRFEGAQFELFGMPIATLPAFEVLDPTVKRKSGFLFPGVSYRDELGASLKVPYYFALSPTYDLTVAATGYTRQGFLGEAEWRQRFDSGEYNLRVAGIYQLQRDAFDPLSVDRLQRGRAMISSKGDFQINPRWMFGWDVMAQTDKNFARTYDIEGNSDLVRTSQIYLTGIGERNYFDLRG
jgi:LPS-assembly protein